MVGTLAGGIAIGAVNYLFIWALRIPPIIATLSASFIIQSVDISYGRGLQIIDALAENLQITSRPLHGAMIRFEKPLELDPRLAV